MKWIKIIQIEIERQIETNDLKMFKESYTYQVNAKLKNPTVLR